MDNRYLDKNIRKKVAEAKAKQKTSPAVLANLKSLSSQLPKDNEREENLRKLSSNNCCTVITGQQIGLFCSPMFSIYKALSAIKTAKLLEQETGVPHVPVFWLQTEDHDFEETSKTHITLNDGEIKTFQINSSLPERVSLAEHKVDNQTEEIILTIEKEFQGLEHTEKLIAMLKDSYTEGTPLYLAYAKFMNLILGGRGLIYFNPRDSSVYEESREFFHKTIEDFEDIYSLLEERELELKNNNIETQVSVREDSPLCFYHPKANGKRYRLKKIANSWKLIGEENSSFSKEQISQSKAIQFSCSALLRPIFQDSLFPTSVYIGGEAERRYMQQISALYPYFKMEQPIIAPRASFAISQKKLSQWLKDLNCTVGDFKNLLTLNDKLIKSLNPKELQPSILSEQFDKKIEEIIAPIKEAIESTDKTLLGTLDKSLSKIRHSMQPVFTKYTKALSSKDEIWNSRIEKLKKAFNPLDTPQERIISIIPLYANHGERIIEVIYDSTEPLTASETKEILL